MSLSFFFLSLFFKIQIGSASSSVYRDNMSWLRNPGRLEHVTPLAFDRRDGTLDGIDRLPLRPSLRLSVPLFCLAPSGGDSSSSFPGGGRPWREAAAKAPGAREIWEIRGRWSECRWRWWRGNPGGRWTRRRRWQVRHPLVPRLFHHFSSQSRSLSLDVRMTWWE